MNIHAIAIDLDHTLLNSRLEVSERDAKAIKEASKKGYSIIVATGRMPSAFNKYLKNVAQYIDCSIYYNGAVTMDAKTYELIHSQPVPLQACVELSSRFASDKYNVVFFSGNQVLSRNRVGDTVLRHYIRRTRAKIELCPNEEVPTEIPIHKFFIYDLKMNDHYDYSVESPFESAVHHDILQSIPADLRATKTRLGYVDCTHREVSKLKSIDRVLSKKGLVRENLMAIGDGYNDMEMIKVAKLGVAMGNAVEEVKKISKMLVSDNDNAGVAEAIYRVI